MWGFFFLLPGLFVPLQPQPWVLSLPPVGALAPGVVSCGERDQGPAQSRACRLRLGVLWSVFPPGDFRRYGTKSAFVNANQLRHQICSR